MERLHLQLQEKALFFLTNQESSRSATVISVGCTGLTGSIPGCLLVAGIDSLTASGSTSDQCDGRGIALGNVGGGFPLPRILGKAAQTTPSVSTEMTQHTEENTAERLAQKQPEERDSGHLLRLPTSDSVNRVTSSLFQRAASVFLLFAA